MLSRNELKDFERKVYTSYHQDGLLDIFVGFALAAVGAGMLINMEELGIWVIIGFFPLWLILKKKITVPRAGFVELSKVRNKILLNILRIGVGVIVLITFALWFMPSTRGIGFLAIGIVMAILSCFFSYMLYLKRFYWFGLVALVSFAANQFFKLSLSLAFIIPGVVMIIIGVIVLVLFLIKYPKPAMEDKYGD